VLGNQQETKVGEDFYAPVVNHCTVKIMLQHALDSGHELRCFDISEAFLYGILTPEQQVYVIPPKEFRRFGAGRYWLLRNSVYGLKCAPIAWHKEYVKRATALGWVQSEIDPCLFRRGNCLKILYVDDVLISGPPEEAQQARSELMSCFPGRVTEVGRDGAFSFLGMKVVFKREHSCRIPNAAQTDKLLQKFSSGQMAKTPLPVSKTDNSEKYEPVDKSDYRSVVGLLNYLATVSRPDLAYAVQILSRTLEDPDVENRRNAARCVAYVNSTRSRELVLKKVLDQADPPENIISHVRCFSDADFNSEGRSSTGINITLGHTPIHWRSVRQRLSTTSTAEAEFVATAQLIKEITYLSLILKEVYQIPLKPDAELDVFEVNCTPPQPYNAFVDNQAAIKMSEHGSPTPRTRHLLIRFNYIKSAIERGLVKVQYVASALNLADQMTKAMRRDELDRLFGVEDCKN
jgi:hypothetical protein